MSRTLTSRIALGAVLAMLAAAPVLAQQETPAAPAAPAQSSQQQAVTLPEALQGAGLTDVTSKPMRRGDGTRIQGTLPDGNKIDAMLDASGTLRGLRSQSEAALPAALTGGLLPQAVRDNPIFGELTQLQGIFVGERGIKLAGIDAQKNRVHAAFAPDGTLVRFGRGDDEGRGFGRGMDGDHGHDGKGRGGKHGDRDGKRRGHDDDDHRRGDRRDDSARQPVDEAALRQTLSDDGYTRIGAIDRNGPRLAVEATNPEGEAVTLELTAKGELMRETAR